MNIFFLERDPKKCATYHCDKHVVKMALEYAQLLSTALHVTESTLNEWVYKPTHINHPCNKWVRQSLKHWEWVWRLAHNVGNEYTYRYGKIHRATRVVRCLPVPDRLYDLGWICDPPQAMPTQYKISYDTIKAYRDYYINEKAGFCRWTKRRTPTWFTEGVRYVRGED